MISKRIKYICIVGVIIVLLLLCYLMMFNKKKKPTSLNANVTYEQMSDISGSFDIILNQSTREFRANYPIDVSFLSWLASKFGNETITDIAYSLFEGNHSREIWYEQTGNSIHVLWDMYCTDLNYSSYRLSNTIWKEAASEDVTVLDFVGDINFAENWYTMEAMKVRDGGLNDCILPSVQQELQSADITMVNNEFTYSQGGEPLAGKAYTFRADTGRVALLDALGTDIVSLANNHVYDYGPDALVDTLVTLENAGVPYVGAGRNLEEAKEIVYFNINGKKIAYVSATQIERFSNYTKQATDITPGVLKTIQEELFVEVIEEAERNSDYVIAYVHWGVEGVLKADSEQRRLAKSYIDAGADIVIGNHAHRLQGVEYIDGVPVFFGLGNFWFSTGSLYTTILQLRIDEAGDISASLLPCLQQNMTTSLLTEESDRTAFYQYIADISRDIVMDSKGTIFSISANGYSEDVLTQFPYRSGQNYADRTGAYDLEGIAIDIVGNR